MITSKRVRLMGTNYLLDKNKGADFAFSTDRLYNKYKGYAIEVERSNDNAKQSFALGKVSINTDDLLTFVGNNNAFISAWYNQKTGEKVDITSLQRQQIVNTGSLVEYTNKYVLEIPQNTSLSVSGISACNRLKNLNAKTYIGFKGQKSIINYSSDYVYPIKCGVGLMDFALFNVVSDIFWYDADGNISTANRPAPNLTNAGITYLFSTEMLDNAMVLSYGTEANYLGNLKDVPRLTYYLSLSSCSALTGSLADLGGRITNTLVLEGCSLITGDLSDLKGSVTYLLGLSGCALITGDLSDLQGKITYYLTMNGLYLVTGSLASLNGAITYLLSLSGCALITGAYTPVGLGIPEIFVVSSTNMSGSDMDNTLISLEASANLKDNVSFTAVGMIRTNTSNAVITELTTNHSWTITEMAISDNIEDFKNTSLSLAVGDKESNGRSVFISSNGYRVCIIGITNNKVIQYGLGSAYNISSSVYQQEFSVTNELTTNCCSLFFRDGYHMYAGGFTTNTIAQYELGTGWEVSTAVYKKSFNVSAQSTNQRKIFINPTGTKLYVLDSNSTKVYQYTLSTPWDISTASYDSKDRSFISEFASAQGLTFNSVGTKMYASGGDNIIHQYNLSTAWDVSTAIYANKTLNVSSLDSAVRGFCLSVDNLYLYIIGSSTDKIYEYAV